MAGGGFSVGCPRLRVCRSSAHAGASVPFDIESHPLLGGPRRPVERRQPAQKSVFGHPPANSEACTSSQPPGRHSNLDLTSENVRFSKVSQRPV